MKFNPKLPALYLDTTDKALSQPRLNLANLGFFLYYSTIGTWSLEYGTLFTPEFYLLEKCFNLDLNKQVTYFTRDFRSQLR